MKRSIMIAVIVLEIFVIVVLSINVFVNISTLSYIYPTPTAAPSEQVAIIPGAAVLSNGTLSTIFRDRANTAIALYKDGKVTKLLVSGDNSTVSHNEVNPARNYLLAQGIPDQDIFLDHAGFDTYSTMFRAKYIFEVSSTLIVTQSFHLPRAVFIARELGIPAYGVSAENNATNFYDYFREFFADEKAVLDLMFDRHSKYLGDQIPITGDGTANP